MNYDLEFRMVVALEKIAVSLERILEELKNP
jgi:hypothetical protein